MSACSTRGMLRPSAVAARRPVRLHPRKAAAIILTRNPWHRGPPIRLLLSLEEELRYCFTPSRVAMTSQKPLAVLVGLSGGVEALVGLIKVSRRDWPSRRS
jgi:hypothetical protein